VILFDNPDLQTCFKPEFERIMHGAPLGADELNFWHSKLYGTAMSFAAFKSSFATRGKP
jgi:hypothetical protein